MFEQWQQTGSVALWTLNRELIEDTAPQGQMQIISVQDSTNSRLGNHFGVFTYLKTNESALEDYLTSKAVDLFHALAKVELPKDQARRALEDLMLMGIHHGTISPDARELPKQSHCALC